MGFSDKLKELGDKARGAAAEHRDQIANAVEGAAVVADKRTKGRYTDKIQRAAEKTGSYVERLGPDEPAGAQAQSGASEPSGAAAPPSQPGASEPSGAATAPAEPEGPTPEDPLLPRS